MDGRFFLCSLLITAMVTPRMEIDERLRALIVRVEQTTKNRVFIAYLPVDAKVSRGGASRSAIYALLKPGATTEEVVHELLHSVVGQEGYFGVRANSMHPAAGNLAANLQDFVLHPMIDERAKAEGFPQGYMAAEHARYIRNYLSSRRRVDESQMDGVALAANALGVAEVLQRGKGPVGEIRKLVSRHQPRVYVLVRQLLDAFPAEPRTSAANSYRKAQRVLDLLDQSVKQYDARSVPSQTVRLVDPRAEPLIDEARERVIQEYLSRQE